MGEPTFQIATEFDSIAATRRQIEEIAAFATAPMVVPPRTLAVVQACERFLLANPTKECE